MNFIGEIAFENSDGPVEPPQIPRLHEAVLTCCRQQESDRKREGTLKTEQVTRMVLCRLNPSAKTPQSSVIHSSLIQYKTWVI